MVNIVIQQIETVISANANVHLWGEIGTGKRLAATLIHQLSPRKAFPLIIIDCAPPRKAHCQPGPNGGELWMDFEDDQQIRRFSQQAGQGTLVLMDINQMGTGMQKELLLIIKHASCATGKPEAGRNGPARIVTTSSCDPGLFWHNGSLIPELFECLSPTQVKLKPLRNCKENFAALANHYFGYFSNSSNKQVLPKPIMQLLLEYDWPGNLYELENTIQRYLAYDEVIFLPVRTNSIS